MLHDVFPIRASYIMLRLLLPFAVSTQAYFNFIDVQLLIVAYALQNNRRMRIIAFYSRRKRRIRRRLWASPSSWELVVEFVTTILRPNRPSPWWDGLCDSVIPRAT